MIFGGSGEINVMASEKLTTEFRTQNNIVSVMVEGLCLLIPGYSLLFQPFNVSGT